MRLSIDSRQCLRRQRKLAPALVGVVESDVQIRVNEQVDGFVKRATWRGSTFARVEHRMTGLQFADEESGPLGYPRVRILLKLAQGLDGFNAAQLFNRPQRIPAHFAVAR